MVDRVGQQLGNYQLIKLIGQGSLAEVYLGILAQKHHPVYQIIHFPRSQPVPQMNCPPLMTRQ